MKIHDNGQWTSRSVWTIDTYRNFSGRSNRQDFFFYFRRQLCGWSGLRVFEHLAGIGVGELVDRLSTLRCELVDESLSLWFKDGRFGLGHENLLLCFIYEMSFAQGGHEAISCWVIASKPHCLPDATPQALHQHGSSFTSMGTLTLGL